MYKQEKIPMRVGTHVYKKRTEINVIKTLTSGIYIRNQDTNKNTLFNTDYGEACGRTSSAGRQDDANGGPT